MPVASTPIAFAALPALTAGSMDLFKGHLRSVSIERSTATIPAAEAYIRIGLQLVTAGAGPVIAMLASGYIGPLSDVAWDGDIPLDTDMRLFWFGYSFTAFDARLGIITSHD